MKNLICLPLLWLVVLGLSPVASAQRRASPAMATLYTGEAGQSCLFSNSYHLLDGFTTQLQETEMKVTTESKLPFVTHCNERQFEGGDLKAFAVYAPEPAYPSFYHFEGEGITVVLQIMIDSSGNIRSLRDQSGPRSLSSFVAQSACSWRFRAFTYSGHPIWFCGLMAYHFKKK